ncbi:MAG: P1 family peptidase [Gemmatimonadota bacterium]|nr:P1 family peptidase [Gemmatimonadota bacterium]MDH3427505.1 P1 family peptidase [Gemmatimonadota bacterium]
MSPNPNRVAPVVWVAAIIAIPTAACAQNPVLETTDRVIVETADMLPRTGIGSVPGVFVGHETLETRPTGCTVVLTPDGAVAGVDVQGGAPGTRETDLLDPATSVQRVHAVFLSGGSAFGLETGGGVSRYLEEQGIGYPVGEARVPIVSGAILFDLAVGDWTIRPDAECGYRAAVHAMSARGPVAEGSVGAGAGATVGKLLGMDRAMKGGIGTASIRLANGLVVAAIVAVNAVGDIIDPATGQLIAGVRSEAGDELVDARTILREGIAPASMPGSNTVIGVVATNARLTQAEATRVARMSQAGLARTVSPTHTPADGDTMFALATGELEADVSLLTIGALAADMVAEAILRGVRSAEGLEGLPSVSDMGGR